MGLGDGLLLIGASFPVMHILTQIKLKLVNVNKMQKFYRLKCLSH